MTMVLEEPVEIQTTDDGLCHIAKDEANSGAILCYCGIIIKEEFCCSGDHDVCGRPRCENCTENWQASNGL